MEHLLNVAGWVGLTWLFLIGQAFRHLRSLKQLVPDEAPRESLPSLSVIIPARNEEYGIGRAVRSIFAQRGVTLEVIAVNDGSTDQTGMILDALTREDPRLRVLHNPDLPPGWLGKCNAMHQGAGLAGSPVLLFTDADVIHKPGGFAAALAELERHRLDFLTLIPRCVWVSLWENVLVGAMFLNVILFRPSKLEDPRSPEAIGSGAFLMVRHDVYRAIGGHSSLRQAVVDDVDLPRLIKRSGYRVGVRRAPEALEVRFFIGNRAAFWGFAKNILSVFGFIPWWISGPVLILAVAFLFGSAPAALIVGLWGRRASLFTAGLMLFAMQYLTLLLFARVQFTFNPLKLLAFPLAAISLTACTLQASYCRAIRRKLVWRDRVIEIV